MPWRPVTKFRIAGESPFFGPGCVELMTLIDETGSVSKASEKMGLSYSKAWRLIHDLEAQAGFEAVSRQQGGKKGGAANLTSSGRRLVERYTAYAAECDRAVHEIFMKHFREEAGK